MSTPSKAAMELARELDPHPHRQLTRIEHEAREIHLDMVARLIDARVAGLVEAYDFATSPSSLPPASASVRLNKALADWRPTP